jgi:hypothetical protein
VALARLIDWHRLLTVVKLRVQRSSVRWDLERFLKVCPRLRSSDRMSCPLPAARRRIAVPPASDGHIAVIWNLCLDILGIVPY